MDRLLLSAVLQEQVSPKQRYFVSRSIQSKIDGQERTSFVVIISGVRRCGKSTLLHQIRMKKQGYYVNFDDERLIDFTVRDFHILEELLAELFGKLDCFFFDEIQNIKGWERFVRRLHDSGKKVYVTGSNASMLSRELGTHLTGRTVSFALFPFSFREFLSFKKYDTSFSNAQERGMLKKYFNEYLLQGGFPEYVETEKVEYLQSLYQNILFRDIIMRYKLPAEKPLKETVYYAMSNIGKQLSFNTIRGITGLTSATTIKEYFEYLENSYLLFLVPRFDYSLKKQIYSPKKIYCVDTALAHLIGFHATADTGRILENVVFLALRAHEKEIYYHQDTYECDFLVRKNGKISAAIQVTMDLKATREREVAGIVEAMKQYNLKEGIILTYDEEEDISLGLLKIKVMPVWKWLLN
ncbi:ATPase [Candidatus Nomurabacteria bacterium RIFCSPHIGHO2_01_FULL_39_10]|uniref:ATPase n=1 Tax=Candidatus Nomurabacteria bacterium RIFCSPHIGHO2_01_FULL_39_10 TaxID=1801733 RepID=A0A1F6V427_9BACT|nr:MAG: ATPase [Candidatus Nomurabacteria bacterium RIFCSPHIGHO2_01_FULL_39_10]